MRVALLIYEAPEAFAARKNGEGDPYIGAWREYYRRLVAAGVYAGGDALELPQTGRTVRVQAGRGEVQDGPFADTKEQLAGVAYLEVTSMAEALRWASECPAAALGAVEARPLAPEAKLRVTGGEPG